MTRARSSVYYVGLSVLATPVLGSPPSVGPASEGARAAGADRSATGLDRACPPRSTERPAAGRGREVMGIPVHDHLILTGDGYTSLAERGLM